MIWKNNIYLEGKGRRSEKSLIEQKLNVTCMNVYYERLRVRLKRMITAQNELSLTRNRKHQRHTCEKVKSRCLKTT